MQLSMARSMTPITDPGSRILDTLKAALVCLDRQRRITYVNATAELLFDNSAASLVGRPFDLELRVFAFELMAACAVHSDQRVA